MFVSKLETGSPKVAAVLHEHQRTKLLWPILLVALATRVWGVWFGFPEIIHPDEHHISERVLSMLKAPEYDLNPGFFEYPSLCFYLLALLYLLVGFGLSACGVIGGTPELYDYAQQNIFYFHLLGRLLSAAFSVATIHLVFLAGRRLWGNTVGLLAAWFLTLGYLHFTDSHYLATDVPSAFFVLWAVYLALTALQERRLKALTLAAFVSGLSASVKYPNGLVLLSILFAAVLLRQEAQAQRNLSLPKFLCKLSVFAAFGFLLGTPYAVLDLKSFFRDLLGQFLHSDLGHLGVEETGFFGYFWPLVPAGGIGMILVAAAFLGLFFSLWRHEARDALLLSFPLFFYLLLGNSALKVDRYLIPAIPFFCIYAALCVTRISAMVRAQRAQTIALIALTALLSVQPAYYLIKWCWLVDQPDTRTAAATWIEHNIPPERMIAMRVGSWMFPRLHEGERRLKQIDLFMEESMRARAELKLKLLQEPVTAWILRHVFDVTASLDDLRQELQNSPTFTELRAPTLEKLRAEGVEIVITSNLLETRFRTQTTQEKFPEMAKSWQDFFASIAREGELLQEFVPAESLRHPWGLGFLERPRIRIYAIAPRHEAAAVQ